VYHVKTPFKTVSIFQTKFYWLARLGLINRFHHYKFPRVIGWNPGWKNFPIPTGFRNSNQPNQKNNPSFNSLGTRICGPGNGYPREPGSLWVVTPRFQNFSKTNLSFPRGKISPGNRGSFPPGTFPNFGKRQEGQKLWGGKLGETFPLLSQGEQREGDSNPGHFQGINQANGIIGIPGEG